MKFKKLASLLSGDFLISDLDENVTYGIDSHEDIYTQVVSPLLEKKVISVSSFYDQVLVKVKL